MLATHWAQSETSFRMSSVTGSLRVPSQALSPSRSWMLKAFAAVYPYPTDRARVPEDEKNQEDHMNHKNLDHKKKQVSWIQTAVETTCKKWTIYEPITSAQACGDAWECENWKQEFRHSHVHNEIVNCSAHRFRLKDYGSDEAVPCKRNDNYHAVHKDSQGRSETAGFCSRVS